MQLCVRTKILFLRTVWGKACVVVILLLGWVRGVMWERGSHMVGENDGAKHVYTS